jgi:site-specific recombinase XerD/CheY-like chemotaxis protein
MRTDFTLHQRPTLEEAVALFCAHKTGSSDDRPASPHIYSRTLHRFLQLTQDVMYADQLSFADVERFDQAIQQQQLSANSRRIKLAAVKAFMRYLEEQEVLSTAVAHRIILPRPAPTAPARPVDIDDAAALMRAVKQSQKPRDIAILAVLVHTGIHISELTDLLLTDLTLTPIPASESGSAPVEPIPTSLSGRLRLRSRPVSQRQAALLDHATCQALSAYLAVRPRSTRPQLFVTRHGTPLSLDIAASIVTKYAHAAGMRWIHASGLRSGYILRQLAAGAPLLQVQSQVGRRQASSTRQYIDLLRSSARAHSAHRRTCGILVVDERLPTRRQLRLILEQAGHQVFEAFDSVSARDMLRLSRLALVVVLSLWPPFGESAYLLPDLVSDEHLFTDHCFIVVMSENDHLPAQVSSIVAAHAIPLLTRPLDFAALNTCIAPAYAELGANGEVPNASREG